MDRRRGLQPATPRPPLETVAEMPRLTVVVPSHNRRLAVQRLLDALSRQTASPSTFDAIVVVDGSSDGTAEALRGRAFPYPLQIVEQASLGPAAARNEGARRASGRVLLFLDDDMEPSADVVAAHLTLHADADDRIGIGALTPIVDGDSLFAKILRYWWTDMQEAIHRPGHRFSFKDLLSGHFSIARARFGTLAGFDTRLRCHEDYEMGFRAIQAGMEFRVARGAATLHHDDSTVDKVFRRKFDEGVADVALAHRHPALIKGLPFAWEGHASRKKRALRRVAWSASTAADALARSMQRMLPLYEAASLRFRWRALLEALLDYWYWRGVADVLHHPSRLHALLASAPAAPAPMTVDLAAGIEAAAAQLDGFRPAAARLVYGHDTVITIPAYPGYEALRGAHLRPLLARWCPVPYLEVAAHHREIPGVLLPLVARLESP